MNLFDGLRLLCETMRQAGSTTAAVKGVLATPNGRLMVPNEREADRIARDFGLPRERILSFLDVQRGTFRGATFPVVVDLFAMFDCVQQHFTVIRHFKAEHAREMQRMTSLHEAEVERLNREIARLNGLLQEAIDAGRMVLSRFDEWLAGIGLKRTPGGVEAVAVGLEEVKTP